MLTDDIGLIMRNIRQHGAGRYYTAFRQVEINDDDLGCSRIRGRDGLPETAGSRIGGGIDGN